MPAAAGHRRLDVRTNAENVDTGGTPCCSDVGCCLVGAVPDGSRIAVDECPVDPRGTYEPGRRITQCVGRAGRPAGTGRPAAPLVTLRRRPPGRVERGQEHRERTAGVRSASAGPMTCAGARPTVDRGARSRATGRRARTARRWTRRRRCRRASSEPQRYEVRLVVGLDLGEVAVAACPDERGLGHHLEPERGDPAHQLQRDHRAVLDAIAGDRARPAPTPRGPAPAPTRVTQCTATARPASRAAAEPRPPDRRGRAARRRRPRP